MEKIIETGFAHTYITPAVGKEIPGLLHKRVAEGILDPLYARACVVDDGSTRLAIVQVDAIVVGDALVAEARRLIQRRCGIARENVLIAATHTHSGGPVCDLFSSEADPEYVHALIERIAWAVTKACSVMRPVLAGAHVTSCEGVAFNRRFLMKGGAQATHPGKLNPDIVAPAGPADPSVLVAGFCDPDTLKPVGCLVNFACHATHINGTQFSADYPKWIVDTLQAVHGPEFGVVFLNGACADVTQMDNQDGRPGEFGPYWATRTGQAVGAAALKGLALTRWRANTSVDRAVQKVQCSVREISEVDEKAARELVEKHGAGAGRSETLFASELLQVAEQRKKKAKHRLEVQAMRLGEVLLWTAPGELFQAYALDVRDRSPFPLTRCVELTNGYAGYICTPAAFEGGGYEVRTARSSFLDAEAGGRLGAAAVDLAKQLYARAGDDMVCAHTSYVWPSADDEPLRGISE
ncbi:MAG: neutral/alkaline non-lysosomal ceramidase N-terminal domain-containing protein [Candidatus Hydrogenedentes bacterium]|nr:neutral/alkaline non-lysosomal ceramidase N-terminal domain-containing protein [Candidatus Hydrogenedentota bacterium]